jgi:uncharacterized protein (DUF1800 family)
MEFSSTFVALNRFGLGRRLGEPLPPDPHDWLRAQLDQPDPLTAQTAPDTTYALEVVQAQVASIKARKEMAEMAPSQPSGQPAPDAMPLHLVAQALKQDVHALCANALTTQLPFRERLVWFWANHFTVSARGLVPTACAGAYVREAIRPNVTARFSDMLLAVMHHPAMLAYLDQAQSAGPDSLMGERKHKGLNENLARECLELHTVSPAAGYTQQDVTNFAKILTGWSIELKQDPTGFKFRPAMHEPGEIEVMGRTWPPGQQGGEALLTWLGTHPATYRHISEKLVRHFVADDPPPSDVHRIETVLRDTQGDLHAASLALIELQDAWIPAAKLRAPQDYVIACLRALGANPDQVPNLGAVMSGLGQGLFQAPFPIGWPDRAADWAGPEAMLQRVDFVYAFAGRYGGLDPIEVADTSLGPLLNQDTRDQMRGAGSRRDAMTLLLASPDFMRR